MPLQFKALSLDEAKAVLSWHYEGEYKIYNFTGENLEAAAEELCQPENHYYGIFQDEELVGHAAFHHEARVAGGDYSAEALDIGVGMRPDWTGQGKGAGVIASILEFAREHYPSQAFRATIAAWNLRSQKTFIKNGFQETSRFLAPALNDMEFIIFTKPLES